ncbi:MAG: nitroreductase family protein [Candidatus Bathyarchaeia archaeon]
MEVESMGGFLEVLKGRRSVRRYLPDRVPMEILYGVLESAGWAPSAHNAQPWRFIAIIDDDLKKRLAEAMAEEWIKDLTADGLSPGEARAKAEASIALFTGSPVLILACLSMEDMDKYPDKRRMEIEYIMAVQSLAAAIQNMLLTIHHMGLGGCWFCAPLFCKEAVRGILGIPSDVEPQALVTLGYPCEEPRPPPRKPIQKFSYLNRWGEEFRSPY